MAQELFSLELARRGSRRRRKKEEEEGEGKEREDRKRKRKRKRYSKIDRNLTPFGKGLPRDVLKVDVGCKSRLSECKQDSKDRAWVCTTFAMPFRHVLAFLPSNGLITKR